MLTHDAAAIAARIPHAGRMCLLQTVLRWDAGGIVCTAASHRDADHPLAQDGRLDAVCGIEYAAQAMAMHAALTAGAQDRPDRGPRPGFLASVRDLVCHVARLDTLAGDLLIEAVQLMGEPGRMIYSFALSCDGVAVVSGRAAVVLAAEAMP